MHQLPSFLMLQPAILPCLRHQPRYKVVIASEKQFRKNHPYCSPTINMNFKKVGWRIAPTAMLLKYEVVSWLDGWKMG